MTASHWRKVIGETRQYPSGGPLLDIRVEMLLLGLFLSVHCTHAMKWGGGALVVGKVPSPKQGSRDETRCVIVLNRHIVFSPRSPLLLSQGDGDSALDILWTKEKAKLGE